MSLRYKRLGDAEIELGAFRKRIVLEDNSRLLAFDRPPREKRKAEIKAMAKSLGRAEGEQHRLPLGGRRLKPEPIERNEDDLHFNVVEYIRRVEPDAIILHSPNLRGVTPKYSHAIRTIHWKLGVEKGTFDLPILYRKVNLAIEFKSPKGGRLSDEQERWQAKFERNGGITLVSNDWYEIVEFLKQHGIGGQR